MKNTNKKLLIVTIVALTLAVACVVGTIAYLQATSVKVKNTFTYGKVGLTLEETGATEKTTGSNVFENEFHIVPGREIAKDPKITVAEGSEDCWIFVRVEESSNLDKFISYEPTYTMNGDNKESDWSVVATTVENINLVYAYKVTLKSKDSVYFLAGDNKNVEGTTPFANGKINVNIDVKSEDVAALAEEGAVQPSLTFTAYAVQAEGFTTAQAAWNATFGTTETPTT